MGGGIHYQCSQSTFNCQVNLTNNTFVGNKAETAGGAINWINVPFNDLGGNFYANNTAHYAPNEGNIPDYLRVSYIQKDTGLFNETYRRLQDENTLPALASGQEYDYTIQIEIIDKRGNVFKQENSARAIISSPQVAVSRLFNQNYIITGNIVSANDGIFKFNSLKVVYSPGRNIDLKLAIDKMTTFGNSISFIENDFQINTEMRYCVRGEEFVNEQCLECRVNTFLINTTSNYSENFPCLQCPDNARCEGQDRVIPNFGYWRSSNNVSNMTACPREESCVNFWNETVVIGNTTIEETVYGDKCQSGYQGILCSECDRDFSKITDFECGKCPSDRANGARFIFVTIALLAVIFILVRSAFNTVEQSKSQYSVYLKVIANHFQLLGAIANIDFDWPTEIQRIQDVQTQIAGIQDQIISVDCLLMGEDKLDNGKIRVHYAKLLIYFLLPFIFAILAALFWFPYLLIFRRLRLFLSKFIGTLVIIFFLLHPSISKMIFKTYSCMDVEGVSRMRADLTFICYQGQHNVMAWAVSFFGLILWVIGIPVAACVFLYRSRQTIYNIGLMKQLGAQEQNLIMSVRTRYGFLFNGYRLKVYYWEVVLLARKVLIIATAVYLSSASPESQVLVNLLIIGLNIVAQLKYNPYLTNELNRIEVFSMVISVITMYAGMIYITDEEDLFDKPALKWILFMIIFIPNMAFLIIWFYYFYLEILKALVVKDHLKLVRIMSCNRINIEQFKQDHGLQLLEDTIYREETMMREQKYTIEEGQSQSVIISEGPEIDKGKGKKKLKPFQKKQTDLDFSEFQSKSMKSNDSINLKDIVVEPISNREQKDKFDFSIEKDDFNKSMPIDLKQDQPSIPQSMDDSYYYENPESSESNDRPVIMNKDAARAMNPLFMLRDQMMNDDVGPNVFKIRNNMQYQGTSSEEDSEDREEEQQQKDHRLITFSKIDFADSPKKRPQNKNNRKSDKQPKKKWKSKPPSKKPEDVSQSRSYNADIESDEEAKEVPNAKPKDKLQVISNLFEDTKEQMKFDDKNNKKDEKNMRQGVFKIRQMLRASTGSKQNEDEISDSIDLSEEQKESESISDFKNSKSMEESESWDDRSEDDSSASHSISRYHTNNATWLNDSNFEENERQVRRDSLRKVAQMEKEQLDQEQQQNDQNQQKGMQGLLRKSLKRVFTIEKKPTYVYEH